MAESNLEMGPMMSTRGARRIGAALLLLCAATALVEVAAYAARGPGAMSDFFGLWSWGRFASLEGTAALYDQDAMHRFQRALDPAYADIYYPFLYPPTYLLLLRPLALLDLVPARWAWSAVTTAAFLLGVFGLRWRPWGIAAALLAPATVLTLICGQNGLLTAGLMLGGLRCARTRPLLAGLLLGLLSYKPQFAMLIPVALAAAGMGRVMLSGAATAIALAALAGPALWPAWLGARAEHWRTIQDFIAVHDGLIPTMSAFLHRLGSGPKAALPIQAASGLLGAWVVWSRWRREPGSALAIAAVPVATLLATPYAFLYDLPIVAGAALLLLAERPVGALDAGVLAAALALPQLMFDAPDGAVALAAPVLALLLLWIATRPGAQPSPR